MLYCRLMKNKGFTIIELLVVVAIIGLLAVIVLAALSTSKEKGVDASRKRALHEIHNALELFYTDSGYYPAAEDLAASLVPQYLGAPQANLPYFYDASCVGYGVAPAGSCFVLESPLSEVAVADRCWRDDPLGVGEHSCYLEP